MNNRNEFNNLSIEQRYALDKHSEMINNVNRYNEQIVENPDRVKTSPIVDLKHVVATVVSALGIRG